MTLLHRSLLVAVTVLVAVAMPHADARPVDLARVTPASAGFGYDSSGYTFAGPELLGAEVGWSQRRPDASWAVLVASPGRRAAVLGRSASTGDDPHALSAPQAGAGLLAWTDLAYRVLDFKAGVLEPRFDRLELLDRAARRRSSLGCDAAGSRTCQTCPTYSADCLPYSGTSRFGLAGDGNSLARFDATSEPPVVTVVPGAGALPVAVAVPKGIAALQVAGRHLAWIETRADPPGASIVVHDWTTDRELYRITEGVAPSTRFALQADGKVALVLPDAALQPRARLAWTSPAEPRLHKLDVVGGRFVVGLRMAQDRIAFVTAGQYGLDFDGLFVTDLGERRWTVARFGRQDELYPYADAWDFDGDRTVWARERCGAVTVQLVPDVVRATPSPPRRQTCRPVFASGAHPQAPGRMRVRLRCPSGCRGRVTVTALAPGGPVLAAGPVDLPPSADARTVLLPTTRARRGQPRRELAATVLSGRDRRGERVGASRLSLLR